MESQQSSVRKKPRRHLVYLACFLVICVPILYGLWAVSPIYHPPISHRAGRCQNNMKYIALGITYYIDKNKNLPAYTVDDEGRPLHSWRTLILPYIEEPVLYQKIRLDEPWDSEYNQQFHDINIRLFRCDPYGVNETGIITNYYLVTGPGTLFEERTAQSTDLEKHKDESNRKLFLIESGKAVHWMCPEDVSLADYEAGLIPPVLSSHRNVAYSDGQTVNLYSHLYFSPTTKFFGHILPCILFFAIILAVVLQFARYFYECVIMKK